MPTSHVIAPVSAAWFGAITLIVLWTGTVTPELPIVLAAGAGALLLLVPGRYAATTRGLAELSLFALVLYGPIVVSVLVTPGSGAVVGNLGLLLAYSGVGWALAAASVSPVEGRQAAATRFCSGAALGCGLAFVAAFGWHGSAAFAPQWWGRLSFAAHPNLVGLMALAGLMAAGAVGPGWLRLALRVLFVGVIVATGSRTGLVAAGLCLAAQVVPGAVDRLCKSSIRAALPALAVLVLIGAPYMLWVVANDVLLLGDPARGIASGFSGRSVLWQRSWALFAEHPWFGVGYGAHGDVLEAAYAHNMVLALLADTGVVGLGAFALISALACAGFWRWRARPAARVGLVIVLGYWVYGLGEGRALNVGNTLSILFVITLFHGLGLLAARREPAGAARPVEGTGAAPAGIMPPDRWRSAGRSARIGLPSGWPRNGRN